MGGLSAEPAQAVTNPFRWPAPPLPEDEAAFWSEQFDNGVASWRFVLLASFIVTFGWWPTDPWVFGRIPGAVHVLAIIRAFSGGLAFAMYVVVRRVAPFRARPFLSMSAVAVAVSFFAAWQLGRLGGPGTLYFAFTDLMVLTPIAVALRRRERVVLTVLLGLALVAGLFVMHPRYWHDALAAAAISWLCFFVALGIVGGFFADSLRRREFFQKRHAMRIAEELRALKESLEVRVDQRTSEVRRLMGSLESARDAERAHLARELHDELGQELTALRYAVELTRRRYEAAPLSVGRNLAELEGMLQRTRSMTHDLVVELRPRVLDDLGFAAAAEWLVERTREHSGLDVQLALSEADAPLAGEVATAAFRILQEALTNVAKHAQAARVDVAVARTRDDIELVVRDDGAGFDASSDATPASGGVGLIGMRERATALGGSFAVESAPGRGTSVRVRLPAKEAA